MITAVVAVVTVGAPAPVRADATGTAPVAKLKTAPWAGVGADSGASARTAAAVPAAPYGEFTPVQPARLLDTRNAIGQVGIAPIGQFETRSLAVAGHGGVPGGGAAAAVVLNVTVDAPTFGGWLAVWPSGTNRPESLSNLNFGQNQTLPNLVTVGLGTNGGVDIYNFLGRTDVIVDVMGYYSSATGPAGSRFHSVTASRILDTRVPIGVPSAGPRASGSVTKLDFGAGHGILGSAATAVVLNLTVTDTQTSGFLTMYPDDASSTPSSNLNFVAGGTRSNQVIVKVPANGLVDIYLAGAGSANLVVDIFGYFDGVKTTDAGRFIPINPYRAMDTRLYPNLQPGEAEGETITPLGGYQIPSSGVSAVLINLTATEASFGGFLSVFRGDVTSLPTVSNVNFSAHDTVPNHVIAALSTAANGSIPAGSFIVYNAMGYTHFIVDAFGYYTA